MSALFEIVLPVFIVIGAGYLATWRGLLAMSVCDALMNFTQKFAIPCLLFRAISTLDLQQNFDWGLLLSFYIGCTLSFGLGIFGARVLFGRSGPDSVAIGFVALFSNSLLLGLPITERAYGPGSLDANYTIISVHAAYCYLLGITAMEIVRAETRQPLRLVARVSSAMFRNALMIGIGLGLSVNLLGIPTPGVLAEALDLLGRAALPTALFGLGGILYRYRPEGDAKIIAMLCTLSLVVHPAITFLLGGQLMALSAEQLRSATITAAMAPGINAYIFADMYGAARRVAASSVLIGTALTVLTASAWLTVLP